MSTIAPFLAAALAVASGQQIDYGTPSYGLSDLDNMHRESQLRNAAIREDNERRDSEQRLNARIIDLETQQMRMRNEFLNRR